MGPVALTCVFKSGLSTPIRVSLIVAPDSSPRGFGRVMGFVQRVIRRFLSLSTCLVKVAHLLGAPERGPGRCDNTPVGIVRPWGVYFEVRASLFVCLKDKTCLRAEGGQGDDGACCSAAGALWRAVRGRPA